MKSAHVKIIFVVALSFGLFGCGGGGDQPTKDEVFNAFVASMGGAGQPDAPKVEQVQNFQCEKAQGEPGYNCTFDIPGNAVSHFEVRAIKGDSGNWTVQLRNGL